MVKFGKYLLAHRVTEWQSQYVRYKQLKKLLKRVAAERAASADASESTSINNARQVALSSKQWARTARQRVSDEEKHAPVFATSEHQATATIAQPPSYLHHVDRFHSIASSTPLQSPPDPRSPPHPPPLPHTNPSDPSASSSTEEAVAAAATIADHSHVFTTLFASHLQSDSAEHRFFTMLDEDLVTVNTFFLRQEEFFLSKAEVLSDQLTSLLSTPNIASTASSASLLHPLGGRKSHGDLPTHARHVLERALRELYRGLQLLRNYKIMNYTASVRAFSPLSHHIAQPLRACTRLTHTVLCCAVNRYGLAL